MGVAGGPDLIQDGLVLALDASDRNSYVSGSTTWFDLSGLNNSGSLVNGPTFNTGSGGSITLDGTDDYIQTTATNLNANIGTLNLWIKTGFASTDTRPYYFIDTRDSTNDQNIALYYYLSQGGFVIWGNSSLIFSSVKTFSSNTHFMLTLTYNFVSDNYALYINGNLENSSSSAKSSSGAMTKTTLGSRFNQAVSEYFVGNIYNVQVYNRALSASEILQNYNATKTRFGL
jgi:hypothetical protein